jgi:hypothetical protein
MLFTRPNVPTPLLHKVQSPGGLGWRPVGCPFLATSNENHMHIK